MNQPQYEYLVYKIDKKPNCCWDFDLVKKNISFLDGIDAEYFFYLSDVFERDLNGENKQKASVAIRNTYHHALETFMTLMSAGLQAPGCVYAWIDNARTNDVRSIIKQINTKSRDLFNQWRLSEISWTTISDKMHFVTETDKPLVEDQKEIASNFATFWTECAYSFLEDEVQKEYNAIKHGFRSKAGGYQFSYKGKSKTTNAEMHIDLGSSEYGTSFIVVEKIELPKQKPNVNYRPKSMYLNWNPILLLSSIRLLSLSIQNLANYLKISNGSDPNTSKYFVPETEELFNESKAAIKKSTMAKFDFEFCMQGFNGLTIKQVNQLLDRLKKENMKHNMEK